MGWSDAAVGPWEAERGAALQSSQSAVGSEREMCSGASGVVLVHAARFTRNTLRSHKLNSLSLVIS